MSTNQNESNAATISMESMEQEQKQQQQQQQTDSSETPTTIFPMWYKRGVGKLFAAMYLAYVAYAFATVDYGNPEDRLARIMLKNLNYISTYAMVVLLLGGSMVKFFESWWTLKNKRVRYVDANGDTLGEILFGYELVQFLVLFFFSFMYSLDYMASEDHRETTVQLHHMLRLLTMHVVTAVCLSMTKNGLDDGLDKLWKAANVVVKACMLPFEMIVMLVEIPFENKVEKIIEKKIS